MTKDNHVPTQTELAIRNYLKECELHPKHGILTLVFDELTQEDVDSLGEELAEFLEDRLGTCVHVDV